MCNETLAQGDEVGQFYQQLCRELQTLICFEPDWLANLTNTAALLYHTLADINWAGFYLYKQGHLVLGPFQGQPACVRIALGQGVCGAAATQRKTLVVPNVHQFAGHIACDSTSQAEIVVPWCDDGKLIGVLDIDSPKLARFNTTDARGLEQVVALLNRYAKPGGIGTEG
jgi:L-methionine (R)-S-oxide reductase